MRSRYSAYALQNTDYVLESCHPDTRPTELDLNDGIRYTSLKIHEATGDEVDFTVTLKDPQGTNHRFRERSRFTTLDGRWMYLDGKVSES